MTREEESAITEIEEDDWKAMRQAPDTNFGCVESPR